MRMTNRRITDISPLIVLLFDMTEPQEAADTG